MTHKLKALWLTVATAFAMTALLASGAQAQIKVTVGASPAWLTGGQVGLHTFSVESNGPVISCEQGTFVATVTNGATQVTVVPTYGTCHATVGAETLKTTVTMNDCDFLLHGGVEVTSTTFNEGEHDIKCPVGKVIEVHIYKNSAETEELCTLTIAEQLNKKNSETHDIAGTPNDVSIVSEVTVNVTRHGSLLCGKASNSAVYKGTTTMRAYEDQGGSVSNGTVSNLVEGAQVSLTDSK